METETPTEYSPPQSAAIDARSLSGALRKPPTATEPHAATWSRASRRSRPLRVERRTRVSFVSNRTVEERFWLAPLVASTLHAWNRSARRAREAFVRAADARLARIVARRNRERRRGQPLLTLEIAKRIAHGVVGAALARAQARYGVEIFSVVVMSNHFHLVVRTPNGRMSAFMRDFKSQVASVTNLLTGRSGPLWGRRFDVEPVLDDDAAFGRVVYCIDNPSNAGAVADAREWPGLSAAYGLCSRRLTFEFLDRTAWHRANRPADLQPFMRQVALELSPLPAMASESETAIRRAIVGALRHRAHARKGRESAESDDPIRRMESLAEQSVSRRPMKPKRTRRPHLHSTCPTRRREYFASWLALARDYDEASRQYRLGHLDTEFPAGTYRPPMMACAVGLAA